MRRALCPFRGLVTVAVLWLGAAGALCGEEAPAIPALPTQWEQAGWGGGGFFWCCAYHPTDLNILYLGGDVGGIYRTDDQARHWHFVNNGLTNYAVYGMAISRSNPETLYVLTNDGICKTTNGGREWRLLEETARGKLGIAANRSGSVRPIAVDPGNPDIAYAGSGTGKLYKTEDGGRTWRTLPYLQTADAAPRSRAGETPAFRGKGFLVLHFESDTGDWARNGRVEKPCAYPAGSDWSAYKRMTARFFVPAGAPRIEAQLVVQTGDDWRWQQSPFVAGTPGEWTEVAFDLTTLKGLEKSRMAYFVVRSPEAAYRGEVFLDAVALHSAADGTLGPADAADRPGQLILGDWERPGDIQGWRANRTVKDSLFVTEATHSADSGPREKGVVSSVVVAESDPRLVFACTSEYGLLRSQDAGVTWARLKTPRSALCVAVSPRDASTLFGAFGKEGIWRSTDGGTTWAAANAGIEPGCSIREVALHPTRPDQVYAIGAADWKGYFYRSEDGGRTWAVSRMMKRGLDRNPTLPEETGTGSFPKGMADMSRPTGIAISPASPDSIFLSGNWRNCLSTNGGRTWEERSKGADITCVQDIRFCGGRAYVVAMDEGSFVSEDHGGSWRQLFPLKYDPRLSGHQWRLHVRRMGDADRIVATCFPWGGDPNAVLVSDDGGRSFAKAASGLPDYVPRVNCMWGQGYARALAADPSNPDVLYLGIDGDPEPDKGRPGGGVFRSADGGRTWQRLPGQPASRRMFFGLAVDPTEPRRLFWGACGDRGGVYRSEDAGATWEQVFRNEAWVFNVVASPSGVIYCGSQHLWRSEDHGKTWRAITRFPSDGAVVVGIEVDPRDEKRIWVSRVTWGESAQGGVYRTTDGGLTWEEITGDLGYRKPLILRFDPEASELWAGGVGLFKTRQ